MSSKHSVLLILLVSVVIFTEVVAQQQPSAIRGSVSVATPYRPTGIDEDDPPPVQIFINLDGNGLATASGDYTRSRDVGGQTISSTHVARAEVFGGSRPQAVAEASTAVTPNPSGLTLNPSSSAVAQISYEVLVAQRRQPPLVFIPPLRLYVDVRAEVSYSGAPGRGVRTTATVRVSNPSITTPVNRRLDLFLVSEGVDSQAPRWGLRARPGDVFRVNLRAVARSLVRARTNQLPAIFNSDSIAIADPFFAFDQEAFDADMAEAGLETFPLEEYFELVYSENLLESVPQLLFSDGFEER